MQRGKELSRFYASNESLNLENTHISYFQIHWPDQSSNPTYSQRSQEVQSWKYLVNSTNDYHRLFYTHTYMYICMYTYIYTYMYICSRCVCREGIQFTLFLKVKQGELLKEISIQVRTPRQATCGRGHPTECPRQFKERGELKRPLNASEPFF